MTMYLVKMKGVEQALRFESDQIQKGHHLCPGLYYPWFREIFSGSIGEIESVTKVVQA